MTPLAVLLMEAVLSLRFGDATYIAFSNPVSIGDSTYTINRQKASSRPHCASRWRQCLRSPDQKDARVMRAPTRGSKTDFVPRRPLSSERSEEHTSELQSLMRISYAVFCLKKKT